MHERLEQIKNQVKNHKTKYVVAGGLIVGAVVGGTVVYFKVSTDHLKDLVVINAASNTFGDVTDSTINIDQSMTTIIELVRRGHPGFKIQNIQTGETYASVRRAAELLNISRSALQQHLNGVRPDVNGLTFTNLGEMN